MIDRKLTIDYRTIDQGGRKIIIDDPTTPDLGTVIGIFDSNCEEYLINTFIDLWRHKDSEN